MEHGLRVSLVAVLVAAAAVGAAPIAGAAVHARPAIVSVGVRAPRVLPASGARVVLVLRVRNASVCTVLGPRVAGGAAKQLRRVSCASGRAQVTLPPVVNRTPKTIRLRYVVRASGPGGVATRTLTLSEAAAPAAAPTARLSLDVPTAAAAGGSVTISFVSTNATACTLASDSDLWSGANPATVACTGTRTVVLPAATSARRWNLTFSARGAGGTATATATLDQQAPPPAPTARLSLDPGSVPAAGGQVTISYSSTDASSCTLASTPALWSGANPAAVNCTGTYTPTVPASTAARSWTLTFTATNSAGQAATATEVLTQEAAPPQWTISTNWSGYVVSSIQLITQASGTWRVPALDCSSGANTGASAWVGLGGARAGDDLLQTGVAMDCVAGVQTNRAWWELVPPLPEMDFSGLAISAGDVIRGSVYETSGGGWETRVDDLTTGLSGVMVSGVGWGVLVDGQTTFPLQGSGFPVQFSYPGGHSAEWIVEDYDRNGSPMPFVNYGSVSFGSLTTSLASWGLTVDDGVQLVQNGVALSTPSAPVGNGFTVSYGG